VIVEIVSCFCGFVGGGFFSGKALPNPPPYLDVAILRPARPLCTWITRDGFPFFFPPLPSDDFPPFFEMTPPNVVVFFRDVSFFREAETFWVVPSLSVFRPVSPRSTRPQSGTFNPESLLVRGYTPQYAGFLPTSVPISSLFPRKPFSRLLKELPPVLRTFP